MGFFKKLFGKNNDEQQQEQYYEQPYTEESQEYYEQQPPVAPEYDTYETPEEPVQPQQPKRQMPLQQLEEDVYNEVYEAPETPAPYFQEHEVQVRPSHEKPPADYNPFGQRPNGLIGTVPRVSRENFNPFTESGVAPEPVTPRRRQQARVATTPPVRPVPPQAPVTPQPQLNVVPKKKPARYVAPKESFSNDEPVQKKKFEPRLVPSPIYGFQEPPKRPIVTVEHVAAQRERVRTLNDKKSEPTSSEELAEEWANRHPELNAITEQQEVVAEPTIEAAPVVNDTLPNEEVQTAQPVEEAVSTVTEAPTQEETAEAVEEPAEAVEEPVQEETVEVVKESVQEETTEAVEESAQEETVEVVDESVQEETTEVVEELAQEEAPAVRPTTPPPSMSVAEAMALMEQGIEQPVTHGQAPVLDNLVEKELTIAAREMETDHEPTSPTEALSAAQQSIGAVAVAEKVVAEEATVETEDTVAEEQTVEADEAVVEEVLVEAEETAVEETAQQENNIEETAEEAPVVTEAFMAHIEKARPFNVVLLPSEKKKLHQAKRAEELKKLYNPSPLRPTVTVNSYRKKASQSDDEVSPSEIERLAPQAEASQVVEDLNNVQGQAPSEAAVDLVFNEQPEPYVVPDMSHAMSFLNPPVEQLEDVEWMNMQAEKLVRALNDFQIEAAIENVTQGPTVTQFELKVGHGVKLTKITNLADNLKLELAAHDIRIEAPIPGKSLVGIEIPNQVKRPVRLSEITGQPNFQQAASPLEVALGLDLTGQPVTFDLASMPHGLIAGSTGSGKSVCINSILMSLLLKASPQDVKLMLIDPKMVELSIYEDIPHLVSPVITDVKAATAALTWAVEEMERRYMLFHELRVRHISRYNTMMEEKRAFAQKMPYIVIVIDELADLMMQAPQDVEDAICRITQKARACGIHLVVATQRPSVDVITGLIKSNIPTRIAFAVASNVDSRTILDVQGAERLLGRGDMLYLANGSNRPIRLQGTFVTDEEIEDVTDYIRSLGEPRYLFKPEELVEKSTRLEKQDELFEAVCRYIVAQGETSTSALQRQFSIGYNRAARIIDSLEALNYISKAQGGKKMRDVYLTESDIFELFG